MITLFVKLFIKDYNNYKSPQVRQSYGVMCGGIGIGLNILLFIGKITAGLISSSIAITADAFNNLSDAGSSLITLVGFRMAGQKPDKDHPFGHGRIEYVSGLIVSMLIIIMAVELLKSSIDKILHPTPIESSGLILGILAASIMVKIYMFFYNKTISKKIDSAAMDATAMDSLSDTVATTVVLAATLAAQIWGLQIDGYCGVLVGLFVMMAGCSAAKETVSPLLGQSPVPEFVNRIEEIILSHKEEGVLGLHDLVVHDYGPGRVMISAHVEVPASGNILELHDMIDIIERQLAEQLMCHAVIHMDPISQDDTLTNQLKGEVAKIIEQLDATIQFHDFRIVSGPTHTNIIFDVVVPYDYEKSDGEVVNYLQSEIHKMPGNYFAVVDVDKSWV